MYRSELQTTCGIYRKRCTIYVVCVRYKRHNFGFWDWDRMAWAPELRNDTKWLPLPGAASGELRQSSPAYLYTKCYEALAILPSNMSFHAPCTTKLGRTLTIFVRLLFSLQGQEMRQRIRGVYLLQKKLKIFWSCQFLLKRNDKNVHILFAHKTNDK